MSTNLAITSATIPSMTHLAIDKVRQLEILSLEMPQVDIGTSHIIHACMYARTIMIPAGVVLTGALIKIATVIIVHGEVEVYIGEKTFNLKGYNVLPASAHRKQAFFAKTDTYLTMVFATDAKSVAEAELQFTDEVDMLISRKDSFNDITITGE